MKMKATVLALVAMSFSANLSAAEVRPGDTAPVVGAPQDTQTPSDPAAAKPGKRKLRRAGAYVPHGSNFFGLPLLGFLGIGAGGAAIASTSGRSSTSPQ